MATNRDERMKEITDRLQAGLEELFTSEKYAEYLRVMSQFHHYSFNNTLLIAMQKPDATLVAGYRAWEKKFNRHVMKGEKGIQIIAPAPIREKQEQEKVDPATGAVVLKADGQPETEEVTVTIPRFKVSTVFDLAQTDGDPLPELGVEELTASVENYDVFMEAIRTVAPVPIRFDEINSGAKGYYSNVDKEIVIQSGMSEMQTMKTAVHEISHAILHDKDFMQEQGIQKDQMTREVEAESVAFATLAHFELDTSEYSFPYIAGWSSGRDTKELKASLDTIRKTASEIIDSIEESMREQLLERNADRYEIYQIGDESPARDYKFMGLEFAQSHNFEIRKEDYDLIYTAPLADGDTLESLYEKFNLDHPADFTGHSLSVSDVILLHQNGEDHAFFVDSFGFAEIPEFLKEKQRDVVIEDALSEEEKAPDEQERKPVYRQNAQYAREHGELDAYRASMRENHACKEEIEHMIRDNYDGMRLNSGILKPLIDRFGTERMAYVLANTVQYANWDGRYSRGNKEWAASVISGTIDEDRRTDFLLISHPAVLDGFVNMFRYELNELGLEQDGTRKLAKPFIDRFYVVEDLEVKGPLTIRSFDKMDDAMKAYFALPNDKLKAFGIQNSKPLPGSLDFIHCENGIDTATMDYTKLEDWNTPEIQAIQADVDQAISFHETEIAYEMTEVFFTIQNAPDGFDYSFYDKNHRLLDGGLLEDPLPGDLPRTIKQAANEILSEQGLSLDDCRVIHYEDFMEIVEQEQAKAMEEQMVPDKLTEPEKLAADLGQFAYDFDYYEYTDTYDSREEALRQLQENFDSEQVSGLKEWLQGVIEESDDPESVSTARNLLERMDEMFPDKEPSLTFYVAECMEFPVMGEYHEVNTLQEAMELYKQIPADRMHGIKGIGFNLDDGSDYAGAYPLMQGGKVVTEMIDLVDHYKNSPLVQRAVEEIKQYYPDMNATEYQPREADESAPVVTQVGAEAHTAVAEVNQPEPAPAEKAVTVKQTEQTKNTDEKGGDERGVGRRASVLKALRERQAQVKEQEKKAPDQKKHDRKKGEQSL